jgi:hypothetical protein
LDFIAQAPFRVPKIHEFAAAGATACVIVILLLYIAGLVPDYLYVEWRIPKSTGQEKTSAWIAQME